MRDTSQGRADTYRLLGHLLLEEVQVEVLPALRRIPELADTLPHPESPASEVEARLQELRVEHHRLFGMNIYPYESVFLSEEATLDTRETARVEALYREWEFRPPRDLRFGALDHLGLQMLATAQLIDGDRAADQVRWLHRHPVLWGPVLCATVERIGAEPFYRRLARFASRFLLEDLEGTHARGSLPPRVPGAGFRSEGEGDEPTLQDLVDWFSTPVRSGVLMTRTDLTVMARHLDLPVGILAPPVMLKNLFRSAGQFDRTPELLEALTRLIRAAHHRYAQWGTTHPAWNAQRHHWQTRTRATLRLLTDMQGAVEPGS